jgi:hypothetical protein
VALLSVSTPWCDRFLLVRQDYPWSARALETFTKLEPFLITSKRSNSWPGTTVGTVGRPSTPGPLVLEYQLVSASLQILTSAAKSLYDWTAPELPEDLALLRPDASVWLGSIAHERDAWLELTEPEWKELQQIEPRIAAVLKPHPESPS